jgi:hypothetical protein
MPIELIELAIVGEYKKNGVHWTRQKCEQFIVEAVHVTAVDWRADADCAQVLNTEHIVHNSPITIDPP